LVWRAPRPELAQQSPPTTATLHSPNRTLRITLEKPPVVIPVQVRREQARDE
jgi:hypothetical protein